MRVLTVRVITLYMIPTTDAPTGQSIRRAFPSCKNSSPLTLEFSISSSGIEDIPHAFNNIDPPSVGKQWGEVIKRLDSLVRISESISEVCTCRINMGIG